MQNKELHAIQQELQKREPVFHRPEFGTTRSDFDAMMTDDFWEIGASGKCYSREVVLDLLTERHRTAVIEIWNPATFNAADFAMISTCSRIFFSEEPADPPHHIMAARTRDMEDHVPPGNDHSRMVNCRYSASTVMRRNYPVLESATA